MKYFRYVFSDTQRTLLFTAIVCSLLMLFASLASANQAGISFSEDTIGALGDYQRTFAEAFEFELDAQAQQTDVFSLIANVSVQRNFGSVGLKPFASYNRDTIGNTVDAGGLINWSIGSVDIAGGASFRGANPTAAGLEKRFDANNIEVEVHQAGYSPNAYQLPQENNINAVFNTGFDWNRIETDVTVYTPITKRDIVPTMIISRSQTSIALTESLLFAIVVDARTYIHADGAEVAFKPIGSVTYKF